jgi:hypothetical protein
MDSHRQLVYRRTNRSYLGKEIGDNSARKEISINLLNNINKRRRLKFTHDRMLSYPTGLIG